MSISEIVSYAVLISFLVCAVTLIFWDVEK